MRPGRPAAPALRRRPARRAVRPGRTRGRCSGATELRHRCGNPGRQGRGVNGPGFRCHANGPQADSFLRIVGQGDDDDADGGQPVHQRGRQLFAAGRYDGGAGQPALAGGQQFRQLAAPPDNGHGPVQPLQSADQVIAGVPHSHHGNAHREVPPGFHTTAIFALLAWAPSNFGIWASGTSTMTTVDREEPRAVLPGVIWAISAPERSRVGSLKPLRVSGNATQTSTREPATAWAGRALLDGDGDGLAVQPVELPDTLTRQQLVLADPLHGHKSGIQAGLRGQVVLFHLAEPHLDPVQLVGGQRLADGDRLARRVRFRGLVRGADQRDHADHGCQDQQDSDEEPGVFPGRLFQTGPFGCRASTHASAPPVVAVRSRMPGTPIVAPGRPGRKIRGQTAANCG